MLLSISGFLFEDDYQSQSLSFDQFCRIARSAGYGGIELRRTQVNPDTPKGRRKELLDVAVSEGLTVTCLTARGLPEAGPQRQTFFDRYLELCHDLQCDLMKISSDPLWLHEAAEKAEARGVALASNNHIGGDLETVSGTRSVIREVNHPNYGLLYDSLHLNVAGEDYLGCIPQFVALVRNILAHSVRRAREDEEETLVTGDRRWVKALVDDAGVQDWPAILGTFKRLGYDGLITVIESGWPDDRREIVAHRSAALIGGWWDAAGP